MLNILRQILDAVFPTHESIKRLENETTAAFVRYLRVQRHSETIVLSDYNLPDIKAAITANKFHDYQKAADLLGVLVNAWYKSLPMKSTIFVPIPLSKAREKKRGYNQVTRVLKYVSDPIVVCELLVRHKHTAPQTSLPKAERLKNVVDAFSYRPRMDLSKYERVIIVDDVVTTGATLVSAKKILQPHLPKKCELICLALAH